MSTDAQKLQKLSSLISDVDEDSLGAALAKQVQNILDEPHITDLYVDKRGYGTVLINGAECAVVPMYHLKRRDSDLTADAYTGAQRGREIHGVADGDG